MIRFVIFYHLKYNNFNDMFMKIWCIVQYINLSGSLFFKILTQYYDSFIHHYLL